MSVGEGKVITATTSFSIPCRQRKAGRVWVPAVTYGPLFREETLENRKARIKVDGLDEV